MRAYSRALIQVMTASQALKVDVILSCADAGRSCRLALGLRTELLICQGRLGSLPCESILTCTDPDDDGLASTESRCLPLMR